MLTAGLSACGSTDSGQSEAQTQADTQTETVQRQMSRQKGEAQIPETITITSLNGAGEAVELEVPYDPQRIAILDMASLDILDNLGVGDRLSVLRQLLWIICRHMQRMKIL